MSVVMVNVICLFSWTSYSVNFSDLRLGLSSVIQYDIGPDLAEYVQSDSQSETNDQLT